ncbi:MAG: MarR family transcriptional regulator [Candidatus Thermoplasmatota archaeon]
MPFLAVLVALSLPLGVPLGSGGDVAGVSASLDGGVAGEPASLQVGDGVALQVSGLGVQASPDGLALQAPALPSVEVPICLACPTRAAQISGADAPRANDAHGGILGAPTPTEVAAGTSAAAVLLTAALWVARVAGFLPWFSSFSRIEDDKLADHPTRRLALDFIAANPGATVQDVRRALGVAWGTTVHHLGRLERAGLVAVRRVGGRRGHWPLGQAPTRGALPAPAGALAALVLAEPGLPQGELARRTGLLAPAACKHLARLESAGLVAAHREGKRRLYLPTRELAATLA